MVQPALPNDPRDQRDQRNRVLLVLAQTALVREIGQGLDHRRLVTRATASLPEATALLDDWKPALAIADMDFCTGGFLERLCRQSHDRPAVIALTRRVDLRAKLEAFERGVDDLLTIPFAPEELAARSVAVVRRVNQRTVPTTPGVVVGDLQIDMLQRSVRVGTKEVHLTPLEQGLLYVLAANAGRVVTRDEILDTLWGTDFMAESNVVDRHVRNLRAKLRGAHRRSPAIVTVPGRGFRLVTDRPCPG